MPDILQDKPKYLLPTAAGAYHLACHVGETPATKLFTALLKHSEIPQVTLEDIQIAIEVPDRETCVALLTEMFSLGWIDEYDEPLSLPAIALEEFLPKLMSPLSSSGQTLLADSHGLCLFAAGFSVKHSESLAAMTAEFTSLYEKYQANIRVHANLPTQSWGIIDAAGNSHLGTWQLNVGFQSFNLLIQGLPQLNHPNFVIFIWALFSRYYNGK